MYKIPKYGLTQPIVIMMKDYEIIPTGNVKISVKL